MRTRDELERRFQIADGVPMPDDALEGQLSKVDVYKHVKNQPKLLFIVAMAFLIVLECGVAYVVTLKFNRNIAMRVMVVVLIAYLTTFTLGLDHLDIDTELAELRQLRAYRKADTFFHMRRTTA